MIKRTEEPRWRRSGHCAAGSCVEVAQVGDHFLIRDSKEPNGPRLTFTPAEWTAFVAGVKAGDFSFE